MQILLFNMRLDDQAAHLRERIAAATEMDVQDNLLAGEMAVKAMQSSKKLLEWAFELGLSVRQDLKTSWEELKRKAESLTTEERRLWSSSILDERNELRREIVAVGTESMPGLTKEIADLDSRIKTARRRIRHTVRTIRPSEEMMLVRRQIGVLSQQFSKLEGMVCRRQAQILLDEMRTAERSGAPMLG